MDLPTGKTIFSGIQPSGTLHIGNYLGAIKQWVELQKDNKAYFCIVDLHAITVPYNAKQLPNAILDAAAIFLACGIDPDKSTVFVQSHVPAHAELAWLLGTTTPLGELKRMTQFKEKSAKQKNEETLGLFAYPILQAADVLLYNTHVVPIGEDQVQHIELTRDVAHRFNNRFGEVFTAPKAQVNKSTARIMSLTDPTQKMSKSDNPKSYIALTDKPDIIKQKIASAVTETQPIFKFSQSGLPADLSSVASAKDEASAQAGPAVKNLLTIYQAFSDQEPKEIETKFSGGGYKEFKEELAELIIQELTPIREKYDELRQDEAKLKDILGEGKVKAEQVANQTLHQVKKKMGLTPQRKT